MPLLSTRNQDTLDVPDFDDDWSLRGHGIGHGNTSYVSNSNHDLYRRFAQGECNNEEMSVMTFDSTPRNVQIPIHEKNTASFYMNGNTSDDKRVQSTKNVEEFQQTMKEVGVGGRLSHHHIPEVIKPMKKCSTQTYSGTGMIHSATHKYSIDDNSPYLASNCASPSRNRYPYESTRTKGRTKMRTISSPSTPSTQASSQADKSMEELSLRTDEYTPSVFNNDLQPEQQIIKLSIDLATSQQDLDHSNLQVVQYRTEVSKLQSLVEKLLKENVDLKYQMADMEKSHFMEKMHQTPTTMPATKLAIFERPSTSNSMDVTVDTTDESSSEEAFYHDDDVRLQTNSSPELDDMSYESHITCLDLYNTSNICNDTLQEEDESETDTEKDSSEIPEVKPVCLFSNEKVNRRDETCSEDPFATCGDSNTVEHSTNEDPVKAPKSNKSTFGWGAFHWKKKKSLQKALEKFGTEKPPVAVGNNRRSRLFFFSSSSRDDAACDDTVAGTISSVSTAPKQKRS